MSRPNDWQRKTWLDRQTEPKESDWRAGLMLGAAILGLGICVVGLVLSLF